MKILIIGGTRFIGFRLVEKLLEQQHEITMVNRGNNGEKILKELTF